MKIIEITKVFTMKKYPKKLLRDEGIDIFSDEYLIACLLVEKYGGTLKVIKANQKTEHIKYADYLWNGKLWELKQASSLNAIDNRIKKAILQIVDKPGGIIILIQNRDINKKKAMEKTIKKLKRIKNISLKVIIINSDYISILLKK